MTISGKAEHRLMHILASSHLRKVAGLLNRLAISSLGVKVVPADSFTIRKDWPYHLLYFHRLFSLIKSVQGDIVECGVAAGNTLCQLAILVRESGIRRHIWGFDSFEGLPMPAKEELASSQAASRKGWFTATEQTVLHTLRSSGLDEHIIKEQVTLVKGWLSETLPNYRGSSIALLHIDVDLYESYKTVLENLWPKVSVGGIVAFDEYHDPAWPGATKAVDEYFSQHRGATINRDPLYGKYYYVIKMG